LIKNPLLTNSKIKTITKKCKFKSGIVNFIVKRPHKKSNTISVMPVYLMITTDKLIITKDTKRSNLLKSISMDDIQRIDQHYLNTNCFDIIINELKANLFLSAQLSLCTNKRTEMNEWVNAILDFKKCSLKDTKKTDHNGKIILDMQKINEFNKMQVNEKKKNLNELYYDNADKAFSKNDHSIKIFKNRISKLIQKTQMGQIARNQIKRKYSGRLRKAKKFSQNIYNREFKLMNYLTQKQVREKESESKMLRLMNKKKEINLLKRAMKSISEMTSTELVDEKTLYKTQIKLQKQRTSEQARVMTKMITDEDKLSNYHKCFLHVKVKTPKIRLLCKEYFGIYGYRSCKKKINFCSMCCDFHIGVNFPKKRFKCRMKCRKILKANEEDEKKKSKKGKKKNRRSRKSKNKKTKKSHKKTGKKANN